MRTKTVKVLKRDQVLLGESVRLEIGGGGAPVRTQTPSQADTQAGFEIQQARIVESNSEYAVIEITCSCGARSLIQCNYGQMTGNGNN